MTWLTWRQFRGQALTAAAALVLFAIGMLILGTAIRNSYDLNIADCEATDSCSTGMDELQRQFSVALQLSGGLVIVVPAVVGIFWGAPLITREFEAGTHRMVWNQTVTRTSWLAAKLAIIALASLALVGALSILLTWAASPYDELLGSRFGALNFAARDVAPLGYAVFAFVLGTTAGLIVRRSVPAMAVTLVAFTAVQLVVPAVIRPHLQPPVTDSVAFSEESMSDAGLSMKRGGGGVNVGDYTIPGAWMLTSVAEVVDTDGNPVSAEMATACQGGPPGSAIECLAQEDLHFDVSYHPADRYWPFQWLELAIFTGLSALLAGFAFWRIRREFS